jgi:hypothetical protein
MKPDLKIMRRNTENLADPLHREAYLKLLDYAERLERVVLTINKARAIGRADVCALGADICEALKALEER